MGALAESKSSWILGPRSTNSLIRLWERYRRLSLEKTDLSFSELQFSKLGVLPPALKARPLKNGPLVITESGSLTLIEEHFKGSDGRPLQKFIVDSINSRIFTEIDQVFPTANLLTLDALKLMDDISPWCASFFKTMISWVVPIYHEKYGRPFRRGFSDMNHLGVVFTTFAERSSQSEDLRRTVLAIDLAHELGHQALMLYQLADKILETPLDTPVYSSIRKTERPAIMALHACVAAAYMMEVCEGVVAAPHTTLLEKEFASNSLSELRYHQQLGLDSIKKASQFTAIGKLIFADLQKQLEGFRTLSLIENHDRENMSYFGLLTP